MKKVLLTILLTCSISLYSQKENIIERQFMLHFLQENILVIKDNNTNKNYYDIENIEMDLDSLNNYNADILFFKFKIGKNKLKFDIGKLDAYFNSSSCNEYILGFNVKTNNTYRLKGFNGNDLFFLIRDINKLSNPPKNLKELLSNLNYLNIGIDFKCIYKALLKQNFDAECLLECLEPKPAHGKIR